MCRFILYMIFFPLVLFGQFSAYNALPFPYERALNGITTAYFSGSEHPGWYEHAAALAGLEQRYAGIGLGFSRVEAESNLYGTSHYSTSKNSLMPGNIFFVFPSSFLQVPLVFSAGFDGFYQPYDAEPVSDLQSEISMISYEQSGIIGAVRFGMGIQPKDWLSMGVSLRRFHGDIRWKDGILSTDGFERKGDYKFRGTDVQLSARISSGRFNLDGILNLPFTLMSAENVDINTAFDPAIFDVSYKNYSRAGVQIGYRFNDNEYLNYAFSYMNGSEYVLRESDYSRTIRYKAGQSHALNAGLKTTLPGLNWNMMGGYFITEHPALETTGTTMESFEMITRIADHKWHDGFVFSVGPEFRRFSFFISGNYQNDDLYIHNGFFVPPYS